MLNDTEKSPVPPVFTANPITPLFVSILAASNVNVPVLIVLEVAATVAEAFTIPFDKSP